MGLSGKTALQRFWDKVELIPEHLCWEWTGNKTERGYGQIYTKERHTHRAHRFSWEIHRGPIEIGLHVLHKCDNRGCVNPNHLFLGTHDDNMRDKAKKGRARTQRGMENKRSKLNNEQVTEIFNSDLPTRFLQKKFEVSRTVIQRIRAGNLWRHLTQAIENEKMKGRVS